MALMRFAIFGLLLTLAAPVVSAQDVPPPGGAQPAQDPQQTLPPPSRIREGGNVSATKITHQVMPVYPEVAKIAHVTGTVVLHVVIGRDGTIMNLEFVSGPPLLMKAAMDAVKQWRYDPTLLDGEPVEVDTTISVVFTLGGNSPARVPAPAPQAPRIPLEATSPAPPIPPPATGMTGSSTSGTLLSDIPAATPPYLDSTDGMNSQMASVFREWWSGDKEKFAAQLGAFALADPQAWLTQTFGAEKGLALVPDYANNLEKFKSHIWRLCGNWGNDPALAIKVESSEPPKPAEEQGEEGKLSRPIAPIRIENFRITFMMGERALDSAVFSFIHSDGAFRLIGGTYPFWNQALQAIRRSTNLPTRIRVGGNVAATQLLHTVQPEYPPGAKKKHIQGNVRLHAIIGKDGHILNLQVIEGDPELAIAAQDAVRQWTYKPTLLNGNPVEVDTTILVVFTLERH